MTEGNFEDPNRNLQIDTSSPENFINSLSAMSQMPKIPHEDILRLHELMSQEQILAYYTALDQFRDAKDRLEIDPKDIIRPKVLFHASQNGNIQKFEPREEKKRHPDDPPQVFGSPSEVVSSMFIVPADDSFTISGSYDGGKTWVYIIGDLEGFKTRDNDGYLYTLPQEKFEVDPNQGLRLFEWTSQETVTPKSKEHFDSGLELMKAKGVKVYVVDMITFKRFATEDHITLLNELSPI